MVTFVNNHLTILCHEVFHPFLVVGALKNGNIYTAAAFGRPPPIWPIDCAGRPRNIANLAATGPATVDDAQDQCVHLP